MRVPALCAAVMCATFAFAQAGLQGQPAQNADLIRALDSARTAFAAAQRDAANSDMEAFKKSLNVANVRWAECYGKYREWPTSDTAWRPNFDAINTALLAAVNAITPGNSLPAAKVQIDAAASTLTGLRTRNHVPDLKGSIDRLDTSLRALETTIAGLQGRQLTTADIDALQTSFGAFRDSWALFTEAVIDTNALGLGEGRLNNLAEYIALQNIGIDAINNILRSSDTRTLLVQWQSTRDQIRTLLTELNQDPATAAAIEQAAAAETTQEPDAADGNDDGKRPLGDRPRLLPRLRR